MILLSPTPINAMNASAPAVDALTDPSADKTTNQKLNETVRTVSDLSLSHLPPDEQSAISRALDGELDAFNELVVKYQRMAYSVAYRMLHREDEAEDAVQESFIKAYRALESFRGGQFKSWLMRIVVNTCYDVLRINKRAVLESIDTEVGDDAAVTPWADKLEDKHESPHDYAERMELSARIELGMLSLPEDQRVVLMLCDVHGYAYDEIAEITQQPMGTVKSRINRARAKLREFLLEQPELLPSPLRPKNT